MANDPVNQDIDNSCLTLEEVLSNSYESNAVWVVCEGKFFRTVGHVGREIALQVKEILSKCKFYRVDIVDWG